MEEIILNDSKNIGAVIKGLRSERKITQEELANFAGLSRIGVVKLEKDNGDPKLSTLLKIAGLLGFEVVLRRRSQK